MMTKIKDAKPKRKAIKSAKQAEDERMALMSYWSEESQLTQRTLIYVAELLEKLVKQRATPRKSSAYQKHISRECAVGKTIQEAAQSWQKMKEGE
jgi:Trp operon repressor